MKLTTLFLLFILMVGCVSESDGIKSGTFELYEENSFVGKIYRIQNYQLEIYNNGIELFAKINHNSDSTYLLSGIEEFKNEVDSIVWLNTYRLIDKNKFKIIATPINSERDFKYEAILLKVDDDISQEYLKRLTTKVENNP